MNVDIVLPSLGDNVTEAFVVDWLVGVGDRVEAGVPLVEVMTDKANVEVESSATGVLVEQRFGAEARVEIGETLGVIQTED